MYKETKLLEWKLYLLNEFPYGAISEIPESLKTLMFNLMQSDTFAHSTISIVHPKIFTWKSQVAVGNYVYRKTGSCLIIDVMGISYTSQHSASVIMQPAKLTHPNAFVYFVFNNTDHNVNTLDGHETFHCLGGIKVLTTECNIEY